MFVAACSWAVPADPGENARLRSRSFDRAEAADERPAPPSDRAGRPSAASDDGARALYMERCSKRHAPLPPTRATAGEWPALVRRYGPRAGQFGADRERVLRRLQANAR